MLKTRGLSRGELLKRMRFSNLDLISELEGNGNGILILFPHYANWEWVISLNLQIASYGYAVYSPIKNQYFDGYIKNIRKRFGTTLVSTKNIMRTIRENKVRNEPAIYGILGYQTPSMRLARYFRDFMGIKVPVHVGAERLAKKMRMPVVYLKVRKTKRSHYEGTFKLLARHPREFKDHGITDMFLNEVENAIREMPELYLWTHRRWKHRLSQVSVL